MLWRVRRLNRPRFCGLIWVGRDAAAAAIKRASRVAGAVYAHHRHPYTYLNARGSRIELLLSRRAGRRPATHATRPTVPSGTCYLSTEPMVLRLFEGIQFLFMYRSISA
jgi:hypothetical protein